jgi:hypothetical protein
VIGMGWVVRLFDRRHTWLRLILLDLSGVAYLVFGHPTDGLPDTRQWQLAVLAFVCIVALCRDGQITRIDEYLDSGKFPAWRGPAAA